MRPKNAFCCSGDFLPLACETMPKTKKLANAQTILVFKRHSFYKKSQVAKNTSFRSQ